MNINAPSSRFISLPFLKQSQSKDAQTAAGERKGAFGFLPNRVRNHIVAMIGEFLGTFLFLFFAFSATQVANAAAQGGQEQDTGDNSLSQIPNASTLLYISLAFGFSLAVNAWVFFRISGGLFNPAVTLGMALIGAVGWFRAGLVFVAQLLGGMASAGIVSALFPGPLNVTTTLSATTSITRGLFIEMFLTFELVFTIFMLAAEKHKGTFLAPIGIGLALFIAELSGVYFTGGSLNPARSFGPCVINRDFPGYHWLYWVGPMLGSLCAVGFYRLVKALEYETANPGQDFNEKEAEVFQFDEDNADTGRAVSRPNIQVGEPDYVADDLGMVRSNSREVESRGRSSRGNRYDGPVNDRTDGVDKYSHRRTGSGRSGHRRSHDQAYRSGPDVEGGHFGAPGMAGGRDYRGLQSNDLQRPVQSYR